MRRSLCERFQGFQELQDDQILVLGVLTVQEHLKLTYPINLKTFCFSKCTQEALPGKFLAHGLLPVLAQVLKDPFGGSLGDLDGSGCSESPSNY